jgi:hypothetical protein
MQYTKEGIQALYPQLTPEKIQALTSATVNVQMLATLLNADYIGRYKWREAIFINDTFGYYGDT